MNYSFDNINLWQRRSPWDIYDEAWRDAIDRFHGNRESLHQGRGDAYRHCLASCMMVREHGDPTAQLFGWDNARLLALTMKTLHPYQYMLLMFLMALLVIYGCNDDLYESNSFTSVESEHAKLIAEIESYQTVEEFLKFLNRHSFKWQEKGDRNVSSKNKRPPFNFYEITVKNYSHLGFPGELLVVFFNNRLIDTTFYPKEFEKYLETLKKVEDIKFNDNRKASIYPYTRVWFAAKYEKRQYVVWADVRLEKEVDTWIKRYS